MEKWIGFSTAELEILKDLFELEPGERLSVSARAILDSLIREINERVDFEEEEAERDRYRNK